MIDEGSDFNRNQHGVCGFGNVGYVPRQITRRDDMSIVEELRQKESRDNRALLDRAADRIEELEAELSKLKEVRDDQSRMESGIRLL